MDPDDGFRNRLDDPAKFVSPYPSFYEGPRIDLEDELEPERSSTTGGARNDDDTTLFVGNLDHRVTDTVLYEMFSQVGYIRDINFPKQDPDKLAVFCFINFVKVESVPEAIERMQGSALFGRNMVLRCRPKSVHADKYGYLYKQKRKEQSYEDRDDRSRPGQSQRRVVVMRGSDLPVVKVKTGFEAASEESKETMTSSAALSPTRPKTTATRSENPNLSPVSETSLQDVVSPVKAENASKSENKQLKSAKETKDSDNIDGNESRRNVVFRNRNDQTNQDNSKPPSRYQSYRQGPPYPSQHQQPYQHFRNNMYHHHSGYYGRQGSYPGSGPPGPYTSGTPDPNFSYYSNQMQSYQSQYWNSQGWDHQYYSGGSGYPHPSQSTYGGPGYYAHQNFNGYSQPPPMSENPHGYSRSQYQWVNNNQWNAATGLSHPYELIRRPRSTSPSKSSKGYTSSSRRSRSRSRSPSSRRYSSRNDRRSRSRSRSYSPSRSSRGRYRSRTRSRSRSGRSSSTAMRIPRSASKERSMAKSSPVVGHRTRSPTSRRRTEDGSESDTSGSSRSRRRQKFSSEKYSSDRRHN